MIPSLGIAFFALAPLFVPQNAATPSETVEDVEVLEKLLVDALDALQPPQGAAFYRRPDSADRDSAGTDASIYDGLVGVSMQANGTVRHARAFHLPGAGLFFAFDVALPGQAVSTGGGQESAPPAKEDEWELARRTLRGEPATEDVREDAVRELASLDFDRAVRLVRGARWIVDEAALERARDVVLDVLARHGRRVRGLAPEESITVALHVTPSRGGPGWWMGTPTGDEQSLDGMLRMRSLYANTDHWSRWLNDYGVKGATPVRLVLQVRVSDLAAAASAADPAAQLRERARVHRY